MSKNRKHKKAAYQRRKTRAQKERAALHKMLVAQKARADANAAVKVQTESSSNERSSCLCRAARRMAKEREVDQLPITKDPTKARRHDTIRWLGGIGTGCMAGAFALASKEHFAFGGNMLLVLAILLAFVLGSGLFVLSVWQNGLLMRRERFETQKALPAKAKKEAIAEARANTLFQDRHKLMQANTASHRSKAEAGSAIAKFISSLPELIGPLTDLMSSAVNRNLATAERERTEAAKNEVETEKLKLELERLKSKGQKPLN